MEATLHALAGLLLKSTGTIILLLLLYIYLRATFFAPLDKILAQRRDLTAGARAAAEAGLKRAENRAAEYEAKIREERSQVLAEQEEQRRRWLADQTTQVEAARAKADDLVKRNRREILEEAEKAQWDLARESESLAEQISQIILQRGLN